MTEEPRSDPILFFIHRLSRSILRASMARYLKEFGLGVPQVQILNAIGARGPLVSKEIADYMAMNKALVSRSLSDLTLHGYTRTSADAKDARRRVWTLTAKGKRLVETCRPIRHERTSKLIAALTEEERALLVDILDRLYVASEALGAEEARTAKRRRRPSARARTDTAGRRGAANGAQPPA